MARTINAKATVATLGTEASDTLLAQYELGDIIVGLGGNDTIVGLSGDDFFRGGDGDDRLIGNAGNDRMFGDAGNDLLVGGDGHDTLYGGLGADTLVGGKGADLFSVRGPGESTAAERDYIADYNHAEGDLIGLDFMSFNVFINNTRFIGDAAFSGIAGTPEIRSVKVGGDYLVEVDRFGDGIADMQILVHSNAALTFDDFFF